MKLFFQAYHVIIYSEIKLLLKGDKPLFIDNRVEIFTPAKKKKGQKFLDSADKLLSKTEYLLDNL